MHRLEILYQEASSLLRELATPKGIMASSIDSDNYKRVWARDSVICGIAGLLIDDQKVISSLKTSLLTLARNQNKVGMIPSNVLESNGKIDVSYGSLVGRLDSNTWFIIGSCLYYKYTGDEKTWTKLTPAITECKRFLEATELNGKGWLYTPLSGNWADEYPIHGYTLYDNCLNIWGQSLLEKIIANKKSELDSVRSKTYINFWPTANNSGLIYQKEVYHQTATKDLKHFCAFILPGIYDDRFDAGGNALAMLQFSLNQDQRAAMAVFIASLASDIGKSLIPSFWPIIDETSRDWYLMKGNYSFDFKNEPHQFHNGGIWPVWMGLFCLGLAKQGLHDNVKMIVNAFLSVVSDSENFNFDEYISSDTLQFSGKHKMGFTASGIVFMHKALQFENVSNTLGL